MQQVSLGKSDLLVSPVCLGAMTFGREADRDESMRIFNGSREKGINFFDCADIYAEGDSERILSELIADCRDEVVITSKVYFAIQSGQKPPGLSRAHIMKAAEDSLARLATDYIDLYFLHHFDENVPLEESLQALDDLVKQGKVRYTGVSNFAAWQIEKALGILILNQLTSFVCVQPMYNLVKRQAEVEILPMAQAEGLAVVPYSPLGAGVLTGKYLSLKENDVRGRLDEDSRYNVRYGDDFVQDVVRRFVDKARELDCSPVALAIAWVMKHPAVTAPIIGGRNLEQVQQAMMACDIDMSDELYTEITALSVAPPVATDRREEVIS